MDATIPVFLSIDDPYVEQLAQMGDYNRQALDAAILMGKSVICVAEMPSIGEHVLIYPRGVFGEQYDMDKSVFWAMGSAIDKLKSAYMDMEENPDVQKRVKAIIKDLESMRKELDKKGWSE